MTLVFIMVQYSALFIRPGHGVAAPLASAAALYAIAASGKLLGGVTLSYLSIRHRTVRLQSRGLSPARGGGLDPSASVWRLVVFVSMSETGHLVSRLRLMAPDSMYLSQNACVSLPAYAAWFSLPLLCRWSVHWREPRQPCAQLCKHPGL